MDDVPKCRRHGFVSGRFGDPLEMTVNSLFETFLLRVFRLLHDEQEKFVMQ